MLTYPFFRWNAGLLGGLLLAATACTDPYLPEALQSPPGYLVVDGFLNAQGISTIKLSRTYAIGSKTTPPVEARARVYLEEEGGLATLLREAAAGTYSSTVLTLNAAHRYRLYLTTLGGKEYASDFVPVKITPPIDKLSWQVDTTGLRISLSTHDPANATHFYRWDYIETWQIDPIYRPQVEYRPNTLPLPDITVLYPTKCWGTAPSTTVLLTNTTPLGQDVVADRLLHQVLPTSERLHNGYSLLAQQQALTKEEFAYWDLQRKNTESIGSLFDPQPVQLTGNVHCMSAPAEPVLGFVGAHSVTEKRLFVARRDLPQAWPAPNGYEACYPPDTLWLESKNPLPSVQSYFGNGSNVPIEQVSHKNNVGYTAKSRDCIDCRTRGTSVKPSFWP
jgi:Domain of unknown function (DUF4249)